MKKKLRWLPRRNHLKSDFVFCRRDVFVVIVVKCFLMSDALKSRQGEIREAATMEGAVVFADFLSHAEMHIPFNSGYLAVLREVFPNCELVFAAQMQHLANVEREMKGSRQIRFEAIAPLEVARSRKAHLPWYGRIAALHCWRELARLMAGRSVRFGALGGMDANLLSVFPRRWARSQAVPLHFVLHNHLGAARQWRTRNPLLRPFDFLSVFARPLPLGQAVVVLELGLERTIVSEFPVHRKRVVTLEHPVLESEWGSPRPPRRSGPLRVAFVGHCGRGKGFDLFVDIADRFSGTEFEFHAIGRLNPNIGDRDLSSLARKPVADGLPRAVFLSALREMDLVCLPIAPENRYVASGSIIDAFAAAKPVLMPTNPMTQAISDKYGRFGPPISKRKDVFNFFDNFDASAFDAQYPGWVDAIVRIRQARTAAALARSYRDAIDNDNSIKPV